jgi:zinc/manganese transport system permease protein
VSLAAADIPIIAPALLAGTLVLVTHVPLGMHILRRGIVFIDLALAQIAALGVIAAGLFGLEASGFGAQLAAAGAALAGAALLTWTEHRWPEVQEAQIGVLFVLAATGGILLLANDPHGGENLRDLLAGQVLWVRYEQLMVPAIGSALIAALLIAQRGELTTLVFYPVFALAVTASVQLVGVYLVFASLIVPGLAARQYRRSRLAVGYAVGLAGYASGLLLSLAFDLPSGALVVWCMSACAVLAFAFGPSRERDAA